MIPTRFPVTLGYHLAMCRMVFGPDSRATKFIEDKIATSPAGVNELVLADESQMVAALIQLHFHRDSPQDDDVPH